MPQSPVSFSRALLGRFFLVAFLSVATPSHAYDGFTVGTSVALPPRDAFVLGARAVLPFTSFALDTENVQVSGRADALFAPGAGAAPALSAALVLSSYGPDSEAGAERYVGIGVGVGGIGADALVPAFLVFAGARLPLAPSLHAAVEIGVTHSSVVTSPGFSLGFEYSFGGAR